MVVRVPHGGELGAINPCERSALISGAASTPRDFLVGCPLHPGPERVADDAFPHALALCDVGCGGRSRPRFSNTPPTARRLFILP